MVFTRLDWQERPKGHLLQSHWQNSSSTPQNNDLGVLRGGHREKGWKKVQQLKIISASDECATNPFYSFDFWCIFSPETSTVQSWEWRTLEGNCFKAPLRGGELAIFNDSAWGQTLSRMAALSWDGSSMWNDFSRPSSESSVLEDLKKCHMHSENEVAVVKSALWVIANLNSCASCLTNGFFDKSTQPQSGQRQLTTQSEETESRQTLDWSQCKNLLDKTKCSSLRRAQFISESVEQLSNQSRCESPCSALSFPVALSQHPFSESGLCSLKSRVDKDSRLRMLGCKFGQNWHTKG